MNAVEAIDLTKNYKNRTAVNAVSLSIGEGEFFALLGPNGAGKTTTIKMLTGLVEPSSGDAVIMGESIVNFPEKAKQFISVSPQETAVGEKLTVKENLELMAMLYGKDKKSAQKSAQEMMERFSLTQRAEDKAKTLSGGLQRKLSIAMALISEPKVLFLDEPTLGLDVKARRELWKTISALKGKVTLVLTTHYLEEAKNLADRICIIDNGDIKITGTAQEIINQSGCDNFEDAFIYFSETGAEECE